MRLWGVVLVVMVGAGCPRPTVVVPADAGTLGDSDAGAAADAGTTIDLDAGPVHDDGGADSGSLDAGADAGTDGGENTYCPFGDCPAIAWAIHGGGIGVDWLDSVAVGPDGSIVVTGYFADVATLGSTDGTDVVVGEPGYRGMFLAKYSAMGALAWVEIAGSVDAEGGPIGSDVEVLSDGSILVVGAYRADEAETSLSLGAGEPNETTLSFVQDGYFVARYEAAGQLTWARVLVDHQFMVSRPARIAASDESFVVVGSVQDVPMDGTAVFAPGSSAAVTVELAGATLFIASFSTEGDLQWVRTAGSNGDDYAHAVSPSPDGAFIVGGTYRWNDFGGLPPSPAIFGAGEPNETSLEQEPAGSDAFIARYEPDGQLGWAKRLTSPGTEVPELSVDPSGDIFVAVTCYECLPLTLGEGEPNETSVDAPDWDRPILARYGADATLHWVVAPTATGVAINAQHGLVTCGDRDVSSYDDEGLIAWHASLGDGAFAAAIQGDPAEGELTVVGLLNRFEDEGVEVTLAEGMPFEVTFPPYGRDDFFIVRFAATP